MREQPGSDSSLQPALQELRRTNRIDALQQKQSFAIQASPPEKFATEAAGQLDH
jgi:hypothetical protein